MKIGLQQPIQERNDIWHQFVEWLESKNMGHRSDLYHEWLIAKLHDAQSELSEAQVLIVVRNTEIAGLRGEDFTAKK